MKLYIYENCPFCARTAFVANALNLNIDYQVVDYADAQTLIDLVGQKVVPVLEKDDGTAMAESLDIIQYFIECAGQNVSLEPTAETKKFQRETFPLLMKFGIPRWPTLGLKEFVNDQSIQAWRDKKETDETTFESLLAQTPQIIEEINRTLIEAEKIIKPESGKSSLPLIDQAIMFSMLRGYFADETIVWPAELTLWMEKNSNNLGANLLRTTIP